MIRIAIIRPLIILSFLGVFSVTLKAQSDSTQMSRRMILEKEYDPIFRDASKINSLPVLTDPQIARSAIEYSNYSIRLNPKLQIPILGVSAPQDIKPQVENGFVRLGVGNYFNTLGQLQWSIVSTPKDILHVGFDHTSTNGKIKLHQNDVKTKMKLNNERFTLGYKHIFDALELTLQGGYLYKGFNYYGYNPIYNTSTKKQNQQGIDFAVGVNSFHNPEGFNYSFALSYDYFGNKHNYNNYYTTLATLKGFKENHILGNFDLFALQPNGNRVGVKGSVSHYMYKNNSNYNNYYSNKDLNDYTLINLNPYYGISGENYELRLGILANYSASKEDKFFVAPDLEGQVKFIDQVLMYAFVKGHVNENSLRNISLENSFVASNIRIQDSRTQINSEVGFKINPLTGLFIQPFVGFIMTDNEHFYVNNLFNSNTGSEFYPIYTDLKHFKVGATVRYQYKKYADVAVSFVKNNYSTSSSSVATDRNVDIQNAKSKAWHKPDTELDLKLSAQIIPSLKLSAGYYLGTGREAMTFDSNTTQVFKLKDINELNLGATYSIIDNFSVWGDVNNLLNRKYEIFQGYPAQGINFMVGASYVF